MDLIIVGAGGMGREVFSWLTQEIKEKKEHKILGFIDDNPNALGGLSYPLKIIGNIVDYMQRKTERYVLAILDPKIRMKYQHY